MKWKSQCFPFYHVSVCTVLLILLFLQHLNYCFETCFTYVSHAQTLVLLSTNCMKMHMKSCNSQTPMPTSTENWFPFITSQFVGLQDDTVFRLYSLHISIHLHTVNAQNYLYICYISLLCIICSCFPLSSIFWCCFVWPVFCFLTLFSTSICVLCPQ